MGVVVPNPFLPSRYVTTFWRGVEVKGVKRNDDGEFGELEAISI